MLPEYDENINATLAAQFGTWGWGTRGTLRMLKDKVVFYNDSKMLMMILGPIPTPLMIL